MEIWNFFAYQPLVALGGINIGTSQITNKEFYYLYGKELVTMNKKTKAVDKATYHLII